MSSASDYVVSGFALVPIPTGLKRPTSMEWNKAENVIVDAVRASQLSGNIGLAHAYSKPTPTMALDLDDIEKASAWLAVRGIDVGELLNAADAVQIVSGRQGRAKLLYRLPTGLAPIESLTIKEEVATDD